MERQQAVAGRGRSLGEDRDRLPSLQRRGHRLDDAERVALALALEVERAGSVDESRHEWPGPDVGLRDEARGRHDRVDRHDVEPGHVVRREQAATAGRIAASLEADAERAQHSQRPFADACVTLVRAEPREDEENDEEPVHAVHDGAQQAQRGASAAHRNVTRPLRRRRGRRRGCSAPDRSSPGRRRACAGCGCAATRLRPSSARRARRCTGRRARRPRGRQGARRAPPRGRRQGGEQRSGPARHRRQRAREADPSSSPHFSAAPSRSSSPVAPGCGLGERQVLGVFGDRCVVAAPGRRSCRRRAPARIASRSRCWRKGGTRRIAESK